ncbi:hypothetical protein BDZ91DRAFT_746404 [Kalaharituber pfeilii]|nr:hypothetical protein BDZ91DRAFT_746404 [Kalaharituber pfeilii]
MAEMDSKSPSSTSEEQKASSSSGNNTTSITATESLDLSVLQSPLFKIILDDGSACYVHKELLARLSPEWRQHTDNQMKEGLKGEMLLREVDQVTLQKFLQWAYLKEYTISSEFNDPGSALLIYTKLYVLADRFNVQEFKTFNFGKVKTLLKKRQGDQTSLTPVMVVVAARYAIGNLPNLNEDLADYLLQFMASMLSSIHHLPEFASLIREYPDAALVLLRLTPNAPSTSRLSTVNIRAWGQWNPQTPKGPIYWTKPNQGQLPLPSLAFALSSIDASSTDNIKLYASYQWVEKHLNPIYNTILDSGTTIIYGAWCRWLEIPAEHSILRTGTYNMTEPLTNAGGPKLIPIQFSQPFVRNAKVVLFINGMHFDKNYNRRINVEVVDATEKGFTLKLSTWEDTIVLGLGVTWVAYPEGTPGITSGVVNTGQFRSQKNPQQKNAWYKSFVGEAVFRSTPKIFIGLHNCDIGAGTSFRLWTEIVEGSETNQYGFMWRANTWSDTKMYSTGLAYLAFDPNLGEDDDLSAGTPV